MVLQINVSAIYLTSWVTKTCDFLLCTAIWRVQGAPWWVPEERGHSPSDGETAEKTRTWTSPPRAPPSQSPWAQSQPKPPSQPPPCGAGHRQHSWQTGGGAGPHILLQETPILLEVQRSITMSLAKAGRKKCEVWNLIGIVMFSQTVWLEFRSSSSRNWEKTGSFWCCWVLPWH